MATAAMRQKKRALRVARIANSVRIGNSLARVAGVAAPGRLD
jgi:hypothetical protein